jgi:hypothetical protein
MNIRLGSTECFLGFGTPDICFCGGRGAGFICMQNAPFMGGGYIAEGMAIKLYQLLTPMILKYSIQSGSGEPEDASPYKFCKFNTYLHGFQRNHKIIDKQ